jgi:hypothetical protein
MKVLNPKGSERASGRFIGSVFYTRKGTNVIRKYVKPTTKYTESQLARRENFSILSANWRDVLTDAQRSTWNLFKMSVNDVFKNAVQLSGINLYKKINETLLDAGKSLILSAPTTEAMTVPTATMTNDGTGNFIVITKPSADEVTKYAPFVSIHIAGGGALVSTVENTTILTTEGILPSKQAQKNMFRRICFITENSDTDQTVYIRKEEAVDLDPGVHLVVIVQRVTADGMKSAAIRLDGVSVLHTG